jgi:adenylate cyclase
VDPDAVVRRLAAILSADAVSYSRLMAEDEVATVRTLQAHREHLARLVRQHRGRVVDSPGDNLLAEFPSALDAVRSTASLDNEIAYGSRFQLLSGKLRTISRAGRLARLPSSRNARPLT